MHPILSAARRWLFGGGLIDLAPGAPTGLLATPVSGSATDIELVWTAPGDLDIDHYKIYRDNIFIDTVVASPYTDAGLTPGVTYSYEVSAVDDANQEGDRSNADDATIDSLYLDLVSYWTLDEVSGVRYDAFGSNDLTDNNTVGSAAGVNNLAANFVAANNESLSSTAGALALGDTNWTVAGWAYRDALGVDTVVSRGNATPQCILRGDGGTENLTLFTRGAADSVTKVGGFTAAAFHFVVGWHDADNNLIGVSIDGGVAVTAATGGANTSTADPLLLGGWEAHNFMSGLLDECGRWSRVLAAAERTRLYNAGAGKFFPF